MRVVRVRTGVVLDGGGGALARMLPPFKLGVGGPVAGGDQYMPWIHADDLVGIYLAAIDDATGRAPVNGSAPEPVTNKAFSKALGRALHRPGVPPVPGFALQLLYGDMAEIVTEGQRAVPRRALDARLRLPPPRPRRGPARRAALERLGAAAALGYSRLGGALALLALTPGRVARGGTSSQMIAPMKLSSRPVPSPHFSP